MLPSSYCRGTVLLPSSYCRGTVLVPSSYCRGTVLVRSSYCRATVVLPSQCGEATVVLHSRYRRGIYGRSIFALPPRYGVHTCIYMYLKLRPAQCLCAPQIALFALLSICSSKACVRSTVHRVSSAAVISYFSLPIKEQP